MGMNTVSRSAGLRPAVAGASRSRDSSRRDGGATRSIHRDKEGPASEAYIPVENALAFHVPGNDEENHHGPRSPAEHLNRKRSREPDAAGAVSSAKTRPLIKETPAASANRATESEILSCISTEGFSKAVLSTAYKERMQRNKVSGLATSTNIAPTSADKPVPTN